MTGRYEFAGYGEFVEGWCARPTKMVNRHTGDWHLARCKSSRSSRCEWCAEVKRRDVARVGRSGWLDRVDDRGVFLTLTAPGQDVLPWDRSKCHHSEGVTCSGKIGCRVDELAAARWHHDLAQRWSWFVEEVRRLLNGSRRRGDWTIEVEFFKVYEPHQRGVLHVHAMIRIVGFVTERRFRAAVRLCAARYGFGRQLDVQFVDLADPVNAARAAGYSAKYCTKSADVLPDMRRVDVNGEIRTGGLRAWSASRKWGDRMCEVQARRRAFVVQRQAIAAAQSAGPDDGRASGQAAGSGGGAGALICNRISTPGSVSDCPSVAAVQLL